MAGMMELWVALCIGLPIGLGIVAYALHDRRIERARPQPTTLGPSGRSAVLGVPSLDVLENSPQAADGLRGRVRSIYVMSVPSFTRGAEGGLQSKSGLFIIDIEDAVHEPSGFRPQPELEAIGQELARTLGVPFDLR